jgi:hypothetical protein
MLTNFRGKTITKKKDIILACIFFAKKIERKTDKRFRKDFSKKIRNFECIIEPPSRRKKRNILKKRSLKTNNLRIV